LEGAVVLELFVEVALELGAAEVEAEAVEQLFHTAALI
jgi:hypothetical protein